MATALWAFFGAIGTRRISEPLGGLLGFCGWMPFAQQIEELLGNPTLEIGNIEQAPKHLVCKFFFDEIAGQGESQVGLSANISVLDTPVFLSHGIDDAWISVELGRQAYRILEKVMVQTEWHEFAGAEGEGHWIKEPEGFDQILHFLEESKVRPV